VTDNEWIWTDINPGQSVQYYRVRAYSGTTLALREFWVGNMSQEITMARLNRDDYTNLPNKNFTANQPFQFWFNRTIPQATITPVRSNRKAVAPRSLSSKTQVPSHAGQPREAASPTSPQANRNTKGRKIRE
jgi:hypothetical protein